MMVRVASTIEDPMLSTARWFSHFYVFIKKIICLFNSFFEQLGEDLLLDSLSDFNGFTIT